jgi:hypothetical protein
MKFISILFSIISVNILAQSFNSPESAVYDPSSGRYLISNAGTGTTGGSIVAYDPVSQVISSYVETGVNSPKGLCLVNDTLFVTDVTSVKGFNVATGNNVFDVSIATSNFLNDITADDHNLYLSDNGSSRIYVLNRFNQESYVLIQSPLVTSPNGLYYDAANNRLIAVSFVISNSPVLSIDVVTGLVDTITDTSLGQLDGLTMDNDGNYYVSSWSSNSVYRFDHAFANTPVEIATGYDGPADIYFNTYRSEIAVPNWNSSTLEFIPVVNSIVNNSNPYSIKLYPNPTVSAFSITYSIKKPSLIQIQLLDKNGKFISSLKDDQQKSSDYKLNFNAKDLGVSKGVYFIKIIIGEEVFIKRLVIAG